MKSIVRKKKGFGEKKRKEKKNTSTIHIRQKNIVVGFAVIELYFFKKKLKKYF